MSLISRFTTRAITLYQPVDELKISTMNSIMMADSYDPFTYKTQLLEKIFNVAGFVWIVVALAIMIALTLLYVTAMREVGNSKLLEKNIYLSDKVDSPAVYGHYPSAPRLATDG